MSVTMESAVFMGKNYLNNCQSIANTKDFTLKQMFDISTRLVSEQDEIFGAETIGWENHSRKYMSLIVMKASSIFNAQRCTSFQILYCVLVRSSRTPNRTMHGNKDWDGSNYLRFTEALTESTVIQWNSSGIFFPGFNTLQLNEVKSLLLRLGETPENFTGRIFSFRCSTTFLVDQKTMKKECESNARLVP